MIRIAKLHNERMSEQALYEATRNVWKVGERRDSVKYALSVANGVVHELFAVGQRRLAGTISYQTRESKDVQVDGRWEFTGCVAADSVRSKYVGHSVSHCFLVV